MECTKCGGTGHISMYQHVAHGVCFVCDGKGHTSAAGKPLALKLKHLTGTFAGLNKKQTFALYDLVLCGASHTDCTAEVAEFETCVKAGFLTKETRGRIVRYAPLLERSNIDRSIIDWSR